MSIYKDIWATVVGKELPCQCEDGNRAGSFAVVVVRGEAIVGHILKKIAVCSLYLMLGRLDHLSSNRIQTLLWEFSARPSLLLSISNCSVLLVLELTFSKFRTENFFVVQIFRILEFYAKYANFCNHTKISRYTVQSYTGKYHKFVAVCIVTSVQHE